MVLLIMKICRDIAKSLGALAKKREETGITENDLKKTEVYKFFRFFLNHITAVKIAYKMGWAPLNMILHLFICEIEEIFNYDKNKYDELVDEAAKIIKEECPSSETTEDVQAMVEKILKSAHEIVDKIEGEGSE